MSGLTWLIASLIGAGIGLAGCSSKPEGPCPALPGCPDNKTCCNAATACKEQICEGQAWTCRAGSQGFVWDRERCPDPDRSIRLERGPTSCTASPRSCGAPQPCAPDDKCGDVYHGSGLRTWPTATDATGTPVAGSSGCTDSTGKVWPSVGVGSATWFGFTDCGTHKDFRVDAGCRFVIVTYNDCCPGCVMKEVDLDVQELVESTWTTQASIKHPDPGTCTSYSDTYLPRTSLVRLKYNRPSYVCVFEE